MFLFCILFINLIMFSACGKHLKITDKCNFDKLFLYFRDDKGSNLNLIPNFFFLSVRE